MPLRALDGEQIYLALRCMPPERIRSRAEASLVARSRWINCLAARSGVKTRLVIVHARVRSRRVKGLYAAWPRFERPPGLIAK